MLVVTPGKRHRRGAWNDQAACRTYEVRLTVARLVLTCANGAGLAVGVTAAKTAPPLLQMNRRSEYTLIHSPWQSPRPSGSISHTRPRRRSKRSTYMAWLSADRCFLRSFLVRFQKP